MFTNKYPYSDFHELNADWLLGTVRRLEHTIDNMTGSELRPLNVIVIGDSYGIGGSQSGTTYTPFPDYFATYTGATVYNLSESGAGFCNVGDSGNTFSTLLTTLSPFVDKTEIDVIFFMGGYNDRVYTDGQIDTALMNTIALAKNLYPNAKMHVGFIGWGTGAGDYPILFRARIGYGNCVKYNVSYMNNIEFVMHNFAYFDQDGMHPNTDGHIAIAKGMVNYLKTGYAPVKYARAAVTLSSVSGHNVAFSGPIQHELSDDVLRWGTHDQFNVAGLSTFGSHTWDGQTQIYCANADNTAGYGRGYYGMSAALPCIIHLTNGVSYQAMCTLRFISGALYLIPYIIDPATGVNAAGIRDYIVFPPFVITSNAATN